MPKICETIRLAVLFLLAMVSGQKGWSAEYSGSPFIVDSWSNREGLPQSSVISVIQTRDGYLWLGTLKGLVRFDGINFKTFDANNTPGLASGQVVHLFEDTNTNLWIGLQSAGVALLKDGKIQTIPLGAGRPNGQLVSADQDAVGAVWLNTRDGQVARYWSNKIEILNITGLPIMSDNSGLLWVTTPGMLFGLKDTFLIQYEISVGKVDRLLASRFGGYWRLADGRVQKWKGDVREKDFGVYPWGTSIVTAACEDNNGNLIVGTLGNGVYWYDADGKVQNISTNQGLSSVYVLSSCMDSAGNLWVGTDGEGLNRIRRRTFTTPAGVHSWVAQSVSEDKHGGLWMTLNAFGSFRGVSHWMGNDVIDFNVGVNSNPRCVLVDHNQQVWVGTSGNNGEGLFRLEGERFLPAPGAQILDKQIFALFEDHTGRLWVGTQNGLARSDDQGWKLFTGRDGLSANSITAIAEDQEGNLWVGTETGGLNQLNNGKFVSYQSASSGLPGDDISCLHADKEGALWIGTGEHGLGRFQNGKWTRYSESDGLASSSISYITEDADGFMWIGSNMGLMRIKKTDLDDLVPGKKIFCRTYVESDGLPTRECSSGSQPAVCQTQDGRLWFPTVKGLVSVKPEELKPNLQPPRMLIESVLVNGREQKTNRLESVWKQSVVIPPGRSQLDIHYTALNMAAPKAVRFRYRLEKDGRDIDWTEADDARVAHYPDVKPGHYHFHVIAANEDGIWNQTGSVLELTVLPRFWQTAWFLVVVIVVLLGLIISAVRYISTQKLQRELQSFKQQEALEKERFRIARDLHDQLGANLTQVALLSEMAEEDKDSPSEVEAHAQQISQTARETTRSLDEIVWAVNPSNDTLEGLVNYACKYAQDYFALAELSYRVDMPTQLPAIPIPPEVRHNVFLAFKEAVNNVVKHAHASEVWVRSHLQEDHFTLEVEDNGRGIGSIDPEAAKLRNGLTNMRKRMEDIHGEFAIVPGEKSGTIVRLKIPLLKVV